MGGGKKPYQAKATQGGKNSLGRFSSAVEAALAYARHLGPAASIAAAAEAEEEAPLSARLAPKAAAKAAAKAANVKVIRILRKI